ncbi:MULTISPECIES: hypothetical protein [unclassified Microcoleus]|uniref:hypothetical protein n=1 Tax=unclassified Microcoleus TaxID=2642155 RepID=UPI002FD49753
MPFQKNHKLGAKPIGDEPMDRTPICFNVRTGVREKLKTIPDWKERQARRCRSVDRWTNGK